MSKARLDKPYQFKKLTAEQKLQIRQHSDHIIGTGIVKTLSGEVLKIKSAKQ
jgi:hypothetical protein